MFLLWRPFVHVFFPWIPFPVRKEKSISDLKITAKNHFRTQILTAIQPLPFPHFLNSNIINKHTYNTITGQCRISTPESYEGHFCTFCCTGHFGSLSWSGQCNVIGIINPGWSSLFPGFGSN